MTTPLEWFPVYLSLWQGETVKLLSLEAQGAYMQILALQFQKGSVPSDLGQLSRLIGCEKRKLESCFPEISSEFVEGDPGRIFNPHMAEIREEQIRKSEAAKSKSTHAINKRWDRYRAAQAEEPATGLTPRKLSDPSQIAIEQHAMAFSALPASHQTDEMRNLLSDWVRYRKQKKFLPYVPAQIAEAVKPLADASVAESCEMIRAAIAHGWKSFYRLDPEKANGHHKNGHVDADELEAFRKKYRATPPDQQGAR